MEEKDMKKTTRKLMSLLMVFAIVCSMVPAAMAAYYDDIDWDDGGRCDDSDNPSWKHDPKFWYTDDDGYDWYYCEYCDAEGYAYSDHSWEYEYYNGYKHWTWCTDRGCEYYGYNNGFYENCESRNCPCKSSGYGDLTVTYDDDLGSGDVYDYDEVIKLEVYAEMDDHDDYDYEYDFDWEGDLDEDDDYYDEWNYNGESYAYMDTSKSSAEVTCYVTVYDEDGDKVAEDEVTWEATAGDADITVEATVSNSSEGYQFDEKDDEGYDSIEDQIFDAIADLDSDYELEYIKFDSVKVTGKGELDASKKTEYYYPDAHDYNSRTDELLGEVVFTPDEDYEGEVEFGFTAYYYDDYDSRYTDLKYVSGTIVFDVTEGSQGIGILYTAESGETVALVEDDFVGFWETEYPSGTLEYVKFTSVSTGNLYDYYDGGSKKWTDVETKNTKCYLDPSKNEIGLDDLTYVPGRNTTSATIKFTATGTTGRRGAEDDVSGTITILYTDGDVTPIKYTSTGTVIDLDADDFTAKYKEVMNVSKASGLQIQFLEAPANGELYMNYSAKNSTELTDSNVMNYMFSTTASATRSIEDVTYVPSTRNVGDTIKFACYSGSQLKFIGTVSFEASKPVAIELFSSSQGVDFKVADFYNSANTGVLTSSYIVFGSPSSGTLYVDYANGKGTKVASYHKFAAYSSTASNIYSIADVTYVPAAGFSGAVQIPFVAASLTGGQVNGTVTVNVAKNFSDVTSKHWAYEYVTRLSAQGIVGGYTDGTFGPNRQLTYGEALKLIMEAAGYPSQSKTGSHWASGYLTAAYRNGLVTSTSIDLNAYISRTAVAEIAAKALGLGSATRVNVGIVGPTDTTNGYVYALYNAGIVNGSYNSKGANVYSGSSTIVRAEISKIICLVNDYYVAHN